MDISKKELGELIIKADAAGNEDDVKTLLKAYNIKTQERKNALLNVARKPPRRGRKRGQVRRERYSSEEWYSERIPKALGVSQDQFEYEKGLPVGKRMTYSVLSDMSARRAYLNNEYGSENVKALNVGGDPSLLYKEPSTNKWRMADSMTIELADFTADLAGEGIPTALGIASGLATTILTSPSGLLTAGTGPVLAGAAVGSTVEGAAKTAMETFVRSANDIPTEIDKIGIRNAKEAALNAAIDVATFKTGRLVKAFVGQKGAGLAAEEIENLSKLSGIEMPRFLKEGEEQIVNAQRIASKFPDSTVAKFYEDVRDATGKLIESEVHGGMQLKDEVIEAVNRKSHKTITDMYTTDIIKIESALDDFSKQKDAITSGISKPDRQEIKNKFKTQSDLELQRQLKNVQLKTHISVEKQGRSFQSTVADKYVGEQAELRKLYSKAYSELEDTYIDVSELRKIFSKSKNKAILSEDSDVISVLSPTGLSASGQAEKALSGLKPKYDPMMNLTEYPKIGFRQLNELLRKVREKSGFSSTGTNASQGSYKDLAIDLSELRDEALKQSEKGGKLFSKAEDKFKAVDLQYQQPDIAKAIEAKAGQSYGEAIAARVEGKRVKLPELKKGGTEVAVAALQSPQKAKNFLELAGNTLESKKILRQIFLEEKGLVAGTIDKKALNFSSKERELIEVLWGEKNWKRKMATFNNLKKQADSQSDYIEGLTNETYNRLMIESEQKAQNEIEKIAVQEVKAKKELNDLNKNLIVKLMAQGKVPLPENQITIDSFSEALLKSNPADLKAFMGKLNENPIQIEAFKQSVLGNLVTKAGRNSDASQVGRYDYRLWNIESMDSLITKYENSLNMIFGKESVGKIKTYNSALKRFSTKELEPRGKASAAGSMAGRISIFMSDVGGAFKDRFSKLLLASHLKSPVPLKKIKNRAEYEQFMEKSIRNIFIGSNGIQMLMQDADADPEFRKELTRMYAEIFSQ